MASARAWNILAGSAFTLAACSGPPASLVNPVDPAEIHHVSKYNSCCGHAYPEQDSPNSAKHYFYPVDSLVNTNDRIHVYAACAGKVVQENRDMDSQAIPGIGEPRGQHFHLYCDGSSTRLRYFHVNHAAALLGSHVDAGALLGTADVRCQVGTPPNPEQCSDFDVAVSDHSDEETASLFSRLTPEALAAWAPRGLTSVSQVLRTPAPTCEAYACAHEEPDTFTLSP